MIWTDCQALLNPLKTCYLCLIHCFGIQLQLLQFGSESSWWESPCERSFKSALKHKFCLFTLNTQKGLRRDCCNPIILLHFTENEWEAEHFMCLCWMLPLGNNTTICCKQLISFHLMRVLWVIVKITVSLVKFTVHLNTFQDLFVWMTGVSHGYVTVKARHVMLFSKYWVKKIDSVIELLSDGSANFASMIYVWRATAGRGLISKSIQSWNPIQIQIWKDLV